MNHKVQFIEMSPSNVSGRHYDIFCSAGQFLGSIKLICDHYYFWPSVDNQWIDRDSMSEIIEMIDISEIEYKAHISSLV